MSQLPRRTTHVSGYVWRNFFTMVETNTTAGGRNVTEATPLAGDGFGTFPLYKMVKAFSFLPDPALPVCSAMADSCAAATIVAHADMGAGGALYRKVLNVSSDAGCCDACKAAAPACQSFVRGPDQTAHGVVTCFLLKGEVTHLKYASDRNYGCVGAGR